MQSKKILASLLCTTMIGANTIPVMAQNTEEVSEITTLEDANNELLENEEAVSQLEEDDTEEEKETSIERTIDLRIAGITDLHTYLMNYDYYTNSKSETYGLNKIATLLNQVKAEADRDGDLDNDIDNIILVDNGDTIQGTLLGDYYSPRLNPLKENHPAYEALEYLGFDVTTLGNHEFNYGLDFLNNVIETSNISIINSNVYNMDGSHAFNPYKIIEETVVDSNGDEQTIKVGVCGFVPPQILTWDGLLLKGKVQVKDIYESAVEMADKLKNEEECDVVIALAHTGYGDDVYTKDEENAGYQLSQIDGIDLLVNGHTHQVFPGNTESINNLPNVDVEKGTINGMPTMLPGSFGQYLGVADLKLKEVDGKWKVVDGSTELRKVDKSVDEDESYNEIMREYHENTVEYANSSIGKIDSDVNTFFSLVGDSNAVELVAKAQAKYAEKLISSMDTLTEYKDMPILSLSAPFKAGSSASNYTNIEAGEFKIYNAADLYKYSNTVVLAKLKGSEIKELLEATADVFNMIDPESAEEQELINQEFRAFNFDVVEGLTYEIDVTKPSKYELVDGIAQVRNADAERIVNLKYKGKDVDPDQEFIVVTNNYRAGSNFFGTAAEGSIIYEDSAETRAIIADYIREAKVAKITLDNNWKIKAIPDSKAIATFTSNSKAVDYLGTKSPVSVVETLNNDLTKFKYDLTNDNYVSNTVKATNKKPSSGSSSSSKPNSNSENEESTSTNTTVKETGWIKNEDGSWIFKKDGEISTGWNLVDDKWYFMNDKGIMQTGWQLVNNKWYLMDNSGAMTTGWQKVNEKWYYLNSDGDMKSGWHKDTDGRWYHLSESGAMTTGWLKDTDGRWYYLKDNGEMAANETIDGYYLGSNGAWIK